MTRSSHFSWLALGVVAALSVPSAAQAAPEWQGDFEPGDFSQWTLDPSNIGNSDGLSVVEEPVLEGSYAARIEIGQADVAVGGLTRNELEYSPNPDTFEGSERFYALALRAGETPWGNDWHSLWYWEGNPIFVPIMTLNVIGPQMQFRTLLGEEQELWNAPFVQEQWHEFVLHVMWSADPSVGFVELYYGGDIVVPVTNVQTMVQPGTPNFMHAGVLRSENIATNEVLYIDAVRSGATLEDVMPGAGGDTGGDDDGMSGSEGSASEDDAADDTGGGADDSTEEDGGGASAGDTGQGSGTGGTAADGSASDDDDDDGGGCGCTTSNPTDSGGWLAGLVLLAWFRRRAA